MAQEKRYNQIDTIKGLAALMVLVNHSLNFVFTQEWIFKLSRCCVALFILCAGFTLHISFSRFAAKGKLSLNNIIIHFFLRSVARIILPYSVYVIVFYVAMHKCIDLPKIIEHIFSFNINNPCYYFLIYIGLLLITPIVYYIVQCIFELKGIKRGVAQVLFVVFCAVIGYLNVRYTLVLETAFAAGKFLFGGTYLPLYVIGVMISKYLSLNDKFTEKKVAIHFIISTSLITIWVISLFLFPNVHIFLENQFIPGIGGNPPSASIFIGSLLLFWFFWSLHSFVELKTSGKYRFRALGACGQCSLYIYMYHQIIKYIMLQIIRFFELPKQSIWYAMPFYLLSTIGVIIVYKLYGLLTKDFSKKLSKTEE